VHFLTIGDDGVGTYPGAILMKIRIKTHLDCFKIPNINAKSNAFKTQKTKFVHGEQSYLKSIAY